MPSDGVVSRSTVTVNKSSIQQLLKLYEAIEAAETIYHSCQSVQYRSFVSSQVKARNIQAAYDEIKRIVGS